MLGMSCEMLGMSGKGCWGWYRNAWVKRCFIWQTYLYMLGEGCWEWFRQEQRKEVTGYIKRKMLEIVETYGRRNAAYYQIRVLIYLCQEKDIGNGLEVCGGGKMLVMSRKGCWSSFIWKWILTRKSKHIFAYMFQYLICWHYNTSLFYVLVRRKQPTDQETRKKSVCISVCVGKQIYVQEWYVRKETEREKVLRKNVMYMCE